MYKYTTQHTLTQNKLITNKLTDSQPTPAFTQNTSVIHAKLSLRPHSCTVAKK